MLSDIFRKDTKVNLEAQDPGKKDAALYLVGSERNSVLRAPPTWAEMVIAARDKKKLINLSQKVARKRP